MVDDKTPITLGIVVGAFGLRGEVVVKVTGDTPEGLSRYASFFWSPGSGAPAPADPEKSRPVTPEWVRAHKGKALVRFKGVTHRVQAEALIGGLIWLPRAELKPVDEADRFYIVDLIGLLVETTAGEPVGRIREVLENPANDIFVVEADGREVLIPHVGHIVKRVDPAGGKVVIEPMPGLLD